MVLILSPQQRDAMVRHGQRVYPEECCGLLLGTREGADNRHWVRELRSLKNTWTPEVNPFDQREVKEEAQSRQNRYWIDPKALLEAQRYGRAQGWVILGVYHSHPDSPAVPSERDRQLAWTEYSYPILSITQGKWADLQSWRLSDAGYFEAERIEFGGN